MTDENKNISRLQSDTTSLPDPTQIREQAKQKAKAMPLPDLDTMAREEIQQWFYELQVRQIEAELQYEHSRSWLEERDNQAALFKVVTENLVDLVSLTDMEGNFTYVVKSHEILGYDTGFLIGKNVMDFVHPEDLPRVLEKFNEFVSSGGHTRRVEYRYRCRDGTYLWLETTGKFFIDENGSSQKIVFSSRNITERKQAEESLQLSHSLLRGIIESSPHGIFSLDREYCYTSFNQAHANSMKEMYGVDIQLGRNFYEYQTVETDKQKSQSNIDRALNGEQFIEETFTGNSDLTRIYASVTHNPIREMHGNVIGVSIFANDITERKRSEDALEHSYDLMRYIIEHANSAVAVHDRELKYIYVSQQYLERFRIRETDVIGKHHYDVFPNLPHKWRNVHQKVLAGEVLRNEKDSYLRQDGTLDWTRWECRPWYEANGHVGGIVVYTEIITERVAAEEALRESEEKFRIVFEQSAIGMGRVKFTDARWVDVNDAFCRMLGYTPEEMRATPWLDITHPDDVNLDLIPFRRMAAGNLENYTIEKRFIHKQGHHVWARLTLSLVRDVHGRPDYEIAIIENIEQRKMAEEALKALADTLEQQVAERTELAETRARQLQKLTVELIEAEERERMRIAGFLHDALQQILAAARMQVEALVTKYPSEKTPKTVKQLLNDAVENTRHLSYELSPPVLHHAGLVGTIEWLARRMHEQFELQVDLEIKIAEHIEINQPLKVFLFRAVQELLFNSVKHGGVDKACVMISEFDNCLVITVSDQGNGFDPEILSSFDKNGLGLVSIKTRARSAGGGLHIESIPGGGSRFTLTVPLNLSETSKPEKSSAGANLQPRFAPVDSVASGDEIRVVFADDHKVIRQALIRLIEDQSNIKVVGEAASGEEALSLARTLNPDVIVMDVSMPVMDGIEATRRIKAELPDVRIIGLSMYEDEQIARTMQKAGAESFLTKTASSAELLKAIYGIRD